MKKKLSALLLAAIMVLSLTACGGKNENYNVGIIQLVQHPALDAATQGFRAALTEKLGDKVSFDEQNASGDVPACAIIANQLVSAKVDLIMANATPALQAAQSATAEIPVLGTSVTDYATALGIEGWTGVTGKNISGTSDLAPLDQQAAVLNELFPDAKNVGILYCSAEPNSKYQSDVITEYLTGMGYACREYTFSDSNDLQTVAVAAAAESDVIYLPTDNTVASNTEIIKNVCVPVGVPIVAGESGICAGCGVATLSISYYDLGYATGLMAYEILVNGADPATMEIQCAPPFTKQYNAEISEALGVTIPSDYEAIAAE
ncbi:MAG: ABC transporter substrate-binding protein [Oscillospiraceae bacterium]|jgi:putative ABC transport system substrate-binding protein|nr:ABC transporter substrate-binding protein [Oscillospiraceae bacterium]